MRSGCRSRARLERTSRCTPSRARMPSARAAPVRGAGARAYTACGARSFQLLDEQPEHVAALLEVFELVEAGGRRREQDDVARLRVGARVRERGREVVVAGI